MNQEKNSAISSTCSRCHRRQYTPRRERLCDRCEEVYSTRRRGLPLTLWKALGFLLVAPLVALSWSIPSPFGDAFIGMLLGHAWLIILGIFVGAFLSRRLSAARVLLFRHRFETEDQSTNPQPLQKGLYEI